MPHILAKMLVGSKLILEINQLKIFQKIHPLRLPTPYQTMTSNQNGTKVYSCRSNPSYLKFWWLHGLILLIGALGYLLRAIYDSESVSLVAMNLNVALVFFGYSVTSYNHLCHLDTVPLLINQLIQFEEQNAKCDRILSNRLRYIVVYCKTIRRALSVDCFVLPLVSFGSPLNVIPSFIPEYIESSFNCLISRVITWIFNFTCNYVVLASAYNLAATLTSINILMLTSTIRSSLIILKRKLTQVSTSEELMRIVKIYQEIQLLCKLYNQIHQKMLLPIFTTLWMSVSIVCSYVTISQFHQLNFMLWQTFLYLAVAGLIVIMFCLQCPADVCKESGGILKSWKRVITGMHSAKTGWNLLKRSFRALHATRIGFASNNYFDGMTTLHLLQFCVDKTVSLLLF